MVFDTPIHANDQSIDRVLRAGLPVALVFVAPNCPPCATIDPAVKALAKSYAGEALVVKIDASENPVTAQRFGAVAVPFFAFIKNSQVTDQVTGAVEEQGLRARLEYLLARGARPAAVSGPSVALVTPVQPAATSSTAPAGSGHPVVVTDGNFEQVVLRSSQPVLVDFWAAWCGPCRMVAPSVEQLAREFDGRAVVAKLDVDANPRTAGRFNIRGIPSLLIFRNGRVVVQIVGAQPLPTLRQHLVAAIF